jgi:rhodanese-related sulfurtransferase
MKKINKTEAADKVREEGVLLLDIRPLHDFANGFIGGSIFVPAFEYPAGSLISDSIAASSGVIVVANENQKLEPWLADLIRQAGKVEPEVLIWTSDVKNGLLDSLDMVIVIEPDELAMDLPFDNFLELADVRSANEFEEGHLADSRLLLLEDLTDPANIALLDEHVNIYLYCSNGERSMMASSVLKQHGMHNLRVIGALWEEICATPGLKVEKDAKKLN